jgi:hypothetical protein
MLATGLSRAGTVRPLLGWRTVASRRLALVVGSQCPALGQLSFLPPGAGPLDVQQLPIGQRLLIRLRDLLVDGPGECAPVEVVGQSQPGLLLNPTAATADAALGAAMTQAHEQEAVLLVYFLGHGTGQQADPAAPAQHLLHVWDTVAEPIDTEPESNGWDPYRLVIRRRPHTSGMVGLVLLVDACRAAWAKQQVDGWGGVRAGLLSAWLGSSGDHTAWDACFTRSLIQRLERGVSAAEHPRAALVPDLLAADLEALAAADCPAQAPRLGGYESHNPVLVVARNRQASDLVAELGIDGLTESLLLRLSEDYVSFAVQPVVDAARADRVVVVIGGPGTGKSTLAAALRRPPSDEVPLAMVQAIAFAAAASSVPDLARTLRGQLDRLPHFPDAARRYQTANVLRWDTLDVWQQLITGPLSCYSQPVRLLVDGLDQLAGGPEHSSVIRALAELITSQELAHVSLLITTRIPLPLPGVDRQLPMPQLDPATARRYFASLNFDSEVAKRLIDLAAGNWLVLALAANLVRHSPMVNIDSLDGLYAELTARVSIGRSDRIEPLLAVLAAAGPGPVLPFDLLIGAVNRLGPAQSRAEVHALLGNPALYAVLDRARAGHADEHLGLFHQTLVDHLVARLDVQRAHRAVADTLDRLAPADRHDARDYRSDPLLVYAFDAGPRHRWEAGQHEQLVHDLELRTDPVPRVNLARWKSWEEAIRWVLGPDHPDTLTIRSKIARWTGQAGDPADALRLIRALLPDHERVLGPDHPDTLAIRHSIAFLIGQAGDPADALRLFRALLPDRERVLGPDHPDTLATRGSIAFWIGHAGDPADALRLFRALLPDHERVLGPDHPATLATRGNIAFWTGRAGSVGGTGVAGPDTHEGAGKDQW